MRAELPRAAARRRVACIHLPAFPLQVLLRGRPTWAEQPAAVVEDDRAQARLLWVNDRARALGVTPGMRYAAALALATGLRGGIVADDDVQAALASVHARLRKASPHLEADPAHPDTLWVDASGLDRITASLLGWARDLRDGLAVERLDARVVVGWRRFATWAVATTTADVRVLASPAAELEASAGVPLGRLSLDARLVSDLARLGVGRVGDLLNLPERGLHERFGEDAARLRRQASGEDGPPAPTIDDPPPLEASRELLEPVKRASAVMFVAKGLLPPLLRDLGARGQALVALHLTLELDHAEDVEASVRPAYPTLDEARVVELLRLKLDAVQLAAAVTRVRLVVEGRRAPWEQAGLFAVAPRRDLAAVERALARIRAELGDAAVLVAREREGHLPEARYTWEPLDRLPAPRPPEHADACLVRRVLRRPRAISTPTRQDRAEGWVPSDRATGPVTRLVGPFVFSGGWWRRELARDYHFAETRRGDLLWVYFDRRRRRWFLQGTVD